MKTFSNGFFCMSAFNWLRFEQAMFSLTHWKVKSFCLTQSMFSYPTSLKRFKAFMKTCLPTMSRDWVWGKNVAKNNCAFYTINGSFVYILNIHLNFFFSCHKCVCQKCLAKRVNKLMPKAMAFGSTTWNQRNALFSGKSGFKNFKY